MGSAATLRCLADASSSPESRGVRSFSRALSAASRSWGCSGPDSQPVSWPVKLSALRDSPESSRRSASRTDSGLLPFIS